MIHLIEDWEPELILPLHKTIYKIMIIKSFSQLRYLPCIDWYESIRFNKVVISLKDVLPHLPLAAVTLACKQCEKVSFCLIFYFLRYLLEILLFVLYVNMYGSYLDKSTVNTWWCD